MPLSHPLRVRGLKLAAAIALYMLFLVASFTGAWIETLTDNTGIGESESHPLRVRGLKRKCTGHKSTACLSHPLRVRGLKLITMRELLEGVSRILYGCVD